MESLSCANMLSYVKGLGVERLADRQKLTGGLSALRDRQLTPPTRTKVVKATAASRAWRCFMAPMAVQRRCDSSSSTCCAQRAAEAVEL